MKYFIAVVLIISIAIPLASQSRLLQPDNFVYMGAFRLPDGSGGSDWGYSGHAMTYNPLGDPGGHRDGFPGSLFGVGHAWHMYVSEFNIPSPVISATKNLGELPIAETLRPFTDVRAGIGQLDVLQEMPRVGMAYLSPQYPQTRPKLYLSWGAHFQEDDQNVASHMWCETDLTGRAGAWRIAGASLYSVNDYMFEIPVAWTDAHIGRVHLATGRFRDGGWSGMGPCLYAIAPWEFGNPPADEDTISSIKLLQYSTTYFEDPTDYTMTNYHNSDEWTGGAWLTAGEKSAVVFVGTKGVGDSAWYGNSLGPCLTCDERGWWSDEFHGQVIFYDPEDLGAVAEGTMQPWEPQPYAVLEIDDVLYSVDSANMKYHTGACAFDRQRGWFFMFEPTADEDKSIVHVWKIDPDVVGVDVVPVPPKMRLGDLYPNPTSGWITIPFAIASQALVTITINDIIGREIARPVDSEFCAPGTYSKRAFIHDAPAGFYIITLISEGQLQSRTLIHR